MLSIAATRGDPPSAERDAYVRPGLPDSALVNFAWEYIDRLNEVFEKEDDHAGLEAFASELSLAAHWQRHAMRLVPVAETDP